MFLEPLEDRRLLAGNLHENFNGNALPATLEESGGSPAYIGGEVVFQGTIDAERRFVRTIDDDFNEVNFVAEVTVKVVNPPSPQNPATGLAFFGMGSGAPNPSSSSEPAFPLINLRHHADTAVLGRVDAADNGVVAPFGNPGSGTHRLRMTWNVTTQSMVFEIDEDYTGGPFVASLTSPPVNGSNNGFNNANSRIFFGGAGGATFDDFRVVVTPAVLSIGDASVTEGNGGTTLLSFPVTLSYPVSVPVSVDYVTQDGTATTADNDYVGVTIPTTFTLPAGATSGTIDITVNGDTTFESNETLKIIVDNLQAGGRAVTLVGTGTLPPAGNPAVFVSNGQALGVSTDRHRDVALGDLDGDGDLDAFVASGGSRPDRVWINQGGVQGGTAGQFVAGQALGNSYGRGVALGDVDGDGDLDAFVAVGFGADKLWLNDGAGNFTDSGQSLSTADNVAVVLADIDGDGDLDAVIASRGNNQVWFNQGGLQGGTLGQFANSGQALPGGQTWGMELGDLDGDGDLDIFAANKYGQPNRVFLNNGLGIFTDSGQLIGVNTDARGGVALGDVDGDGDLDAFVTGDGARGVRNQLFINQGGLQGGTQGVFVNSGQSLGTGEGVALGDLDGDGDLDAFVAIRGNGVPDRVWLNNGAGLFSATSQLLGNAWGEKVSLGDLDGDGDLDAFVADYYQPNRVWINQGIPRSAVTATGTIINDDDANTPPVAQDDEIMTDEDSTVTFNVLVDNGHGPDSDADGNLDPSLTINLTSPTLGVLTDNLNGSFTYDPDGLFESLGDGEFTTEAFTYQIEDSFGETATATVTIKITGQNDAPTAIGTLPDVTVNQNAANSVISLTGLFADVDTSDTLTITAVSSSSGLVTAAVSGNSLTLDYQANQSGTATVTVTATDGSGASVDMTFNVAVLSPAHLANGIIQLINQWKTDGKINSGVANSMIVKVVNSLKSYDKGNLTAAGNQLNALKNEISAKVKPGSLTLADALLANSLIDALYDSMTP